MVRTTAVMESALEVTVVTEGTPLVAFGLVDPPMAYSSWRAGVSGAPPLQFEKVSAVASTALPTLMSVNWLPTLVRESVRFVWTPGEAVEATRVKRGTLPRVPLAGTKLTLGK